MILNLLTCEKVHDKRLFVVSRIEMLPKQSISEVIVFDRVCFLGIDTCALDSIFLGTVW